MIARVRRFALAALPAVVVAITVAAIGATPASAQQVASSPASTTVAQQQQPSSGPTVERAAVGVRRLSQSPATTESAEAAMQRRLGLGQARALMIVGFAAVVIGLLMDNDPGTLIAVGGAVVGLYGLYHYLR
jgi:hypothetical protein